MIAPLDLSTEQMEVYKLLYSRMDFESYLVKYTLEQIVTDSNNKLLLTKKKASLIIKDFINKNLLTIVEKGSRGNATVYKVIKISEVLEKRKSTLKDIQTEFKGNLIETNESNDTNDLYDIEKPKGNLIETQTESKGNLKVTPINDKEIDKEIIILTADEEKFIGILKTIENYPIDLIKDKDLFNTMATRYPNLDLIAAIQDWSVYKKDKPLVKNSSPRAQINTSFKKYAEWNKCLKINTSTSVQQSNNGWENRKKW